MSKLRVLAILALAVILSSCGGGGDSSAAVSPPPPNQAPTANAGADHNVDEGVTVELSGSGADSDGTVVSYSWQQTSGPAVEITNANLPNAFFVAPTVDATQRLVFRLLVTDDDGATDSDTVTITVNDVPPSPPAPPPANNAPTAEISAPNDLSVYVVGDSIQFAGSGSDTEDGALSGGSLVWESDIDGQIGTGTNFNSNTLSPGTHQVSVTATDSSGATGSAETLIRVSAWSAETYGLVGLARHSELFRVEIEIGGVWVDTNAYQHSRQSKDWAWYYEAYPTVHWTTIGVAPGASVNVKITRLNRPSGSSPFATVELLPSRYSKSPSWDADTITFSIEQNEKVYVRINDQDFDTLFVSAVPLKPPVPEGALYFGPGEHLIGVDYALQPSDQTIYLDSGAWVIGTFHTNAVGGDLRIMGPGVLSGEFELWENVAVLPIADTIPYMMIHTGYNDPACPTFDVHIEGITIVASPFWNINFHCLNGSKTIDNINILSPWTYNTDGFNIATKGNVTNVLVFNNDDTVQAEYIFDGNMAASNSVLAGRNPFLIGYGYYGDSDPHEAVVFDIDVLLQHLYAPFHGEIDGSSPDVIIDNQRYQNIRIDGDVDQLIYLAIEDTPWGAPGPAQGNVRDILFENITVTGVQRRRSVIRGKDQANRIDNIRFVNLRIGGTLVTDANKEQYFDISEATVDFSP